MKNQLLEDLDDSQSRIPAAPRRRVQAVPPKQAGQHVQAAAPITPSDAADPAIRQREGVWRKRAPAPSARHAAWSPRPAAQEAQATPPPAAEPPRASPRISPDVASFSSREPDWTVPRQPEEAPWTERWGRKALGWTAGLGAAVAVAATAAWMYRDTQVESTLAVVADHSPAPARTVPSAAPAATPALTGASAQLPDPEPVAPPPLKLLPPEPAAVAAQDATPPAAAAVLAAPVVAEEEPPPVKKPAVKRAPERRVAAASAKRSPPPPKKAAPKPAREPVLARAPAVPARTAPPAKPDPESPLAETLRMCRAAGYHATACLKRGCEATRFGLVCRG